MNSLPLQVDDDDGIQWTNDKGGTSHSGVTGPKKDHTEQTSDGYYCYAKLYGAEVGYKTRLRSESHDPSPFSKCFTFW